MRLRKKQKIRSLHNQRRSNLCILLFLLFFHILLHKFFVLFLCKFMTARRLKQIARNKSVLLEHIGRKRNGVIVVAEAVEWSKRAAVIKNRVKMYSVQALGVPGADNCAIAAAKALFKFGKIGNSCIFNAVCGKISSERARLCAEHSEQPRHS